MHKLNLPEFEYKFKESDGKRLIFDPIRKKYIVLTPEEWVRQHFINLLIKHLSFSPGLFKIESSLKYNRMHKRSDILIFDQNADPYLLVECKSAAIAIDKKAIEQATIYNKSIKARYLAITNGLKTFCFETDWINNESLQIDGFPPSPKL